VGAGTCITIAPTAFDWHTGDLLKADVVGAASVAEEQLREAALACPTGAITVEEVEELLPWQLRGKEAPRRVEKTFMFTDIESSTNLVEVLGDDAWQGVLRWHNETLRSLFAEHRGEEVVATGDGFFVGFDSPDDALACAIAIQRNLAEHRRLNGFAPKVRIGVHASGATQVGRNFSGKGVHEAARIAALATLTEIDVANIVDRTDWYRHGVPLEARTYELIGLPTGVVPLTFASLWKVPASMSAWLTV